MISSPGLALLAGIVAVASIGLAKAHHTFAPEYERDARDTLTGDVTDVVYANPHVHFDVRVTQGRYAGEVWTANTIGINTLPGRGWLADTVTVGQHVTVEGFIGRDGARRLWIQSIVLPSGQAIYPVGRER